MKNSWLIVAVAGLLFSGFGCKTGQPPEHMMIERAYFKCEKCKSLEGGIYGKGPLKYMHSPKSMECVHDWQRIEKDKFEKLSVEWYDRSCNEKIPLEEADASN